MAVFAILKVLRIQTDEIDVNRLNVPDLPQFAIGDPLNVEGTINAENNFPHYTHILTTQSGESYGVRSSTLNLNKFTGVVEIGGTMQEIYKSLPIIESNSIKLPDQYLVIKNNTYFFTKDLLYFDFDQQPGFKARKDDNTIEVYFENTKLASFEPFLCNKVVKDQNCEQLLLDLRYDATENFVSYDGYDYFRYGTGKWITFNNNILGYVVTTEDDERLLDLSNAIKIIDRAFVVKNKDDLMKMACQTGEEKFISVNDYKYAQLDPTHVEITLYGTTTSHYESNCRVAFNLREGWTLDSAILTGKN